VYSCLGPILTGVNRARPAEAADSELGNSRAYPERVLAAISPNNVNILVAFGGGVVSILSPCVLPLLPGYLSVVTGLEVSELQAGETRTMAIITRGTLLFAAGFTTVFVLLGLGASTLGQTVFRNQELLTRVSGAFVLAMALYLAGSQLVRAPRLYGEAHVRVNAEAFGFFAPPVTGAAFALGWTPCLGPVIAAVFSVAATQTTLRSVALLAAYSLGMTASFLAVGLALGRWATPLEFLKRHLRAITLISAAVLAVFGLLLLTDHMWWLARRMTDILDALGLDRIVELG
jgi:cytochrome c-type biogenesis protein